MSAEGTASSAGESGSEPLIPVTDYDRDSLIAVLNYSVMWFNYHAQQRVQAFYLFLVIQSAVIVTMGTLYGNVGNVYIGLISLMGALLAIAFLLLEIRDTELVNNGRYTLDKVELLLSKCAVDPFPWMLPRQRDVRRKDLASAIYKKYTGRKSAEKDANTALLPDRVDYPPTISEDLDGKWFRFFDRSARHTIIFRGLFVAAFLIEFVLFVLFVCAGTSGQTHSISHPR